MKHTQTKIAAAAFCIGCSAGAGAWTQEATASDWQGADRAAEAPAQQRQRTDPTGATISPQAAPVQVRAEAASRAGAPGAKVAREGEVPAKAMQRAARATQGPAESTPGAPPSDDPAGPVLGPYGC